MSDKKNRFKVFTVIMTDIDSYSNDVLFSQDIMEQKFEWWRYSPLNWLLLTPPTTTLKDIISFVYKSYGGDNFFCVLEIDIKDVGGIIPKDRPGVLKDGRDPFAFFENIIKSDKYKFKWE